MNGNDMHAFMREECERKRHLPLSKVRDREGIPWDNRYCNGCGKMADDAPTKFLRCARCRAVFYCNRECQLRDWKGMGTGVTRPRAHKDMCAELLETKTEFEEHKYCGTSLRKNFFASWADQHHTNGSFFYSEYMARRGVLGQLEVGFWAQPNQWGSPYMASGKDVVGFENGAMLLRESFPPLEEGWKVLKQTEFPPNKPPTSIAPPPQGVRSWEEYFRFRGLESTSIAPLLLTYVLSVYQMLHHELNFTRENGAKHLYVHLLGPEIELNFIPLFAELSYLMPGIDLELVMVSPAVNSICTKAKQPKYSNSIIRKSSSSGAVLDATAPDANGGGRVRVVLQEGSDYFHQIPFKPFTPRPDAVLALNAGLASYECWKPTLDKLLRWKIPFVATDQTKVTQRYAEIYLFPTLHRYMNFIRPPSLDITINPFHGVINRDIEAILVPNMNNGYLLVLNRPQLRFGVGQKVDCYVECRVGASTGYWAGGTVTKLNYREPEWERAAPYQILLDNGHLIFAPEDTEEVIRESKP